MWQKYSQLSQEERNTIYALLIGGFSKQKIANYLNRHPSTIWRELKRNKSLISSKYNWIPEDRKTQDLYHYLPDSAQSKRNNRRKLANYRTPLKNPTTFQYVIEKLKIWWSPDIISWVLRNKYKNSCKYTISHETIYNFIYTKHWKELNLIQYLRRKHKTRRKYSGRKTQKLPKIPNPTSIHERKNIFPKSENRTEFWHFEGDSILSKRTTYSSLRTEVERKTRYVFIRKINQKTAENVEFATMKIFENLPKNSIKSTTWDNGTEHTNHEKVAQTLNIKIFFAEPYKSWQRWTNERINWMIREYFPKWTNFDKLTDEEIEQVQNIINTRPRKIFWYKSSQEMWDEEITKLEKQHKTR